MGSVNFRKKCRGGGNSAPPPRRLRGSQETRSIWAFAAFGWRRIPAGGTSSPGETLRLQLADHRSCSRAYHGHLPSFISNIMFLIKTMWFLAACSTRMLLSYFENLRTTCFIKLSGSPLVAVQPEFVWRSYIAKSQPTPVTSYDFAEWPALNHVLGYFLQTKPRQSQCTSAHRNTVLTAEAIVAIIVQPDLKLQNGSTNDTPRQRIANKGTSSPCANLEPISTWTVKAPLPCKKDERHLRWGTNKAVLGRHRFRSYRRNTTTPYDKCHPSAT